MPDRETVIRGLEAISDYFFGIYRNDTDSYKCAKAQEYSDAAIEAIAVLKEQDEKTGHWISVNDGDAVAIDKDGFPERACYCSECKKYLIASDEYAVYGRYCPFCGAKMKSR